MKNDISISNITDALASPKAFSIYAIGGVILTSALSIIATKKVLKLKEESPKEKVKKTIKLYLPVAISCGLTIASIIEAEKINAETIVELENVLNTKNDILEHYRDIALGTAAMSLPTQNDIRPIENEYDEEGDPYVWFYIRGMNDKADRFFKSTKPKVIYGIMAARDDFMSFGGLNLNALYAYLGVDQLPDYDIYGWTYDCFLNSHGYGDLPLDFNLVKKESEKVGEYYEITFPFEPTYDETFELDYLYSRNIL